MNKKVLITIFIVFIMITSVIGFISTQQDSQPNSNVFDYNGHDFYLVQGKYVTLINDDQYFFDYTPQNLENIEVPFFNLASKYYFIYNPVDLDDNMNYNMQKLNQLLSINNVQIVLACDKEENCDANSPIKDCSSDAFYFKYEDNNDLYLENKCVVLEGNGEDISKFVDRINMNFLGII
ncbi:hypothetical protein K8R47_02285 [archaeon]|nr:hypothetical protein [archaeon]